MDSQERKRSIQVRELETQEQPRTTSEFTPEAAYERLQKLPKEVKTCLLGQDIVISFSMFIEEVKRRCDQFRTDESRCQEDERPSYAIDRMWTNIVYRLCMNFLNENFDRRIPFKFQDSALVEYLKNCDLMDMLQNMVDVSQYNSNQAKNELFELMDGESNKRDIQSQQMICDDMKRLYYNFVDLFRHCTGTWNLPIYRPRRNFVPKLRNNNFRENNFRDNNFESRNRSGSKSDKVNTNSYKSRQGSKSKYEKVKRVPHQKHQSSEYRKKLAKSMENNST